MILFLLIPYPLSLISYPLSLISYLLSLIPYPLSLIPYPLSLSHHINFPFTNSIPSLAVIATTSNGFGKS